MVDDFKKLNMQTDFGLNADVQREDKSSPESQRAASLLLQAGALLNPKPENLEYLGAAAVHIYKSHVLGQVFFVSQYPLGKVTEELASQAFTDLRGSVMEAYGRKRQTKRSGF